jgi:excinuclease ABC subunit A
VALTAALGSSLVNTLYVLDEPSAGLHPRDSARVIAAIRRLRDARNTVVVVEHEDQFILAADEVIDIGPGAGRDGGEILFHGPPAELLRYYSAASPSPQPSSQGQGVSRTASYLSRREAILVPAQRRPLDGGCLTLCGARLHNLKDITVAFPLGVLTVVTGVSGSGKSSLVEDTLHPALMQALTRKASDAPASVSRTEIATMAHSSFDRLDGVEQIDEVVLVDHGPIGRTPRSNPVTYLKAFDDIRRVFAETPEARLRNCSAAHFSFNAVGGGRCPKCSGHGAITLDMQFLADVSMTCPECHGSRYKKDVLEIKYRGLSIADVLSMTVREAFTFFRGQRRLQKRLHFLKEVGLDYLPLGQPAPTLSGGESQRLKLAARLAEGARARVLILLDEPTTGLHRADVARLLDCFNSLLSAGHSLIVIEHNLDIIKSADYVIDLGPDAGKRGGHVVARGTPEQVAAVAESVTGQALRAVGF